MRDLEFRLLPGYLREGFADEPRVHPDPLLDRLYRARGVSRKDVKLALTDMLPFHKLKGIEKAGVLLAEAVEKGQRIVFLADYDCDGATSCAVGIRGLQMLGAADLDFVVPSRFAHGYGLTPEVVPALAEQAPDVVVTVDNGISSVAGARELKAQIPGAKLLITDHHLPPDEEVDAADVIVNPNQRGDRFESKALAGCGVIFYVLLATREALCQRGAFESRELPNFASLLDFVALGTVADLVPLDRNNRIMVKAGLDRINAGQAHPGIEALLEVSGRKIGEITSSDFAFGAGPRINAAGRIEDMSIGIRCLLSEDPVEARILAAQLDEINQERKSIEAEMKAPIFDAADVIREENRRSLCFFRDEWHQGVVGILASRIKDEFFRPVICFAADEDGETIKGSARSVAGLHIRDALAEIDAAHPGLILKYGGHAMAAGLTIKKKDFERFSEVFEEAACKHLSENDVAGVVETDGELRPEEMTLKTATLIAESGPWGQGFPEPVFHGRFVVEGYKILKGKHLKMELRPVSDSGAPVIEAIAFNSVDDGFRFRFPEIQASYRLSINEWRGRVRLQMLVERFVEEGF